MQNTTTAPTVLRLPEVTRMIGLSKPSIYRMIARGAFPASVRLRLTAVGWRPADVERWIAERIAERDIAHVAEQAA